MPPPKQPPVQAHPPRPRPAPHVQRAVAAAQTKAAQAFPLRNPAPHVQQAIAAVQAKAKPASAERSLAPHVQAALGGGPPAGVQRAAPAAAAARQPAPHVQAALQGGLQAKPQSPGPRPLAPHVRAAVGRGAGASPALQSARLPGALTVQARVPTFHCGISAVIQRIGEIEGKELVEKARSGMPAGPGNLQYSSKEARQRFNLAAELMREMVLRRDTHLAILDALCSVHGIEDFSQAKSVLHFINEDPEPYSKAANIGKFKKTIDEEARKLKGVADLVLFDFVREKTGGGSCDHYSAHVFFTLASSYPKAKIRIEKYKPVSDETYDITPPEGLPYHRVAYMEDEEGEYILDPWWPGGKLEKITKETKSAYPEKETVLDWHPSLQEFVVAFRRELEYHYETLEVSLPKDPSDEVGAVWTVKKKG
jgi:hypothetical protein